MVKKSVVMGSSTNTSYVRWSGLTSDGTLVGLTDGVDYTSASRSFFHGLCTVDCKAADKICMVHTCDGNWEYPIRMEQGTRRVVLHAFSESTLASAIMTTDLKIPRS